MPSLGGSICHANVSRRGYRLSDCRWRHRPPARLGFVAREAADGAPTGPDLASAAIRLGHRTGVSPIRAVTRGPHGIGQESRKSAGSDRFTSRGGSRRGGRPRGARSTRSARVGDPLRAVCALALPGVEVSVLGTIVALDAFVAVEIDAGLFVALEFAGVAPGPAGNRSRRSPRSCRSPRSGAITDPGGRHDALAICPRSWRSPVVAVRSCDPVGHCDPGGRRDPVTAIAPVLPVVTAAGGRRPATSLEGLRLGGGIAIVAIVCRDAGSNASSSPSSSNERG